MSDAFPADYAARHGLERLRATDPAGFAVALAKAAEAGATLPRLPDKASGPAGVFRPAPTPRTAATRDA